MPFPVGVQTVTVTAGASGYHAPDGTAYQGTIRFTPSVSRVTSAEHGVIALGPVNASLSASGMFTAALLATDASGFSPSGWTYRVDEEFTNAPGRSYNLSLPASAASVTLPALAPVSSSSGTVQSPAVLAVNGETGVVTLDAADVGAVPTSRQVLAGTGLTGGGTLAADRTLTVAFGTSSTTVCVGNDARLSDARTPTAHASSHGSAGSDPITIAQSQVTGLTVALASKVAGPAGATDNAVVRYDGTTGLLVQNSSVTIGDDGSVTIVGNLTDAGDLLVRDSNTAPAKAYRFRSSGGSLDTDFGGADWYWSNFPNADFSGTQRTYMRWENGAAIMHIMAEAQFKAEPFGARVHTLNGAANTAGFFGATPVGRQPVAGPRGGNAALASLLTALVNLGLITDSTTA